MTIQLDPNRIRPSAGGASGANRRRAQNDESVVVPTRADENYVPAPESLMTLINSAVAALRRGVRWDRGTILNLLV